MFSQYIVKQQNIWLTLIMHVLTVMYTAGFSPIELHSYTHGQQLNNHLQKQQYKTEQYKQCYKVVFAILLHKIKLTTKISYIYFIATALY